MNAYIIYKLSSKSKKQAEKTETTSPGRHDMKFKIEVSITIDTLAHGLVSWFGTLHPHTSLVSKCQCTHQPSHFPIPFMCLYRFPWNFLKCFVLLLLSSSFRRLCCCHKEILDLTVATTTTMSVSGLKCQEVIYAAEEMFYSLVSVTTRREK